MTTVMLLQEVASLPVCCIPYLCVVSNRKDRELGFGNFVLALCLFGAVAGLNYWIITAITAQKQKDADEESVASNEPVHLASSSSAGSDSDCSYPSLEQSDTPPDDSDSSTSSSSDGSDFRASLRACFLKSFVFLKGFLKSFLENFLKRAPIPSTLAVRSALRELHAPNNLPSVVRLSTSLRCEQQRQMHKSGHKSCYASDRLTSNPCDASDCKA